ncbi:MAG: hypothetical protein U5L00_00265 [Desulfovermiculus sp.]|nr:hypothetical protein [Desulfovermiculus sp.]
MEKASFLPATPSLWAIAAAPTLPYGDRPTLGASIRRLMLLPEDTVIMPGHEYGPTPSSTLGQEKRHNIECERVWILCSIADCVDDPGPLIAHGF